MHIVTQDRDKIYYFRRDAQLCAVPAISGGSCYGINLMLGCAKLGTFDTPQEAVAEVSAIYSYSGEIYAVSGFSDFNADDFIKGRLSNWEN